MKGDERVRKHISTVSVFIVDYVDRPHTYWKLKRMGFTIDEISEERIGVSKYRITAVAHRLI